MEHISLSGKGAAPLGLAAADVVVGVLFGLATTIMLGHLRVMLAQAVWPYIWVSLHANPTCLLVKGLCGLSAYVAIRVSRLSAECAHPSMALLRCSCDAF